MTLARATESAIARENARVIAHAQAHPDACPNCEQEGGDHCWLCAADAPWNQPEAPR
jgi:hypothetical protein